MRLSGTKATAINQYRGLGNQLWDLAGNRPSLDLRFADDKSLVDATTGTTLVDHTRASSGTYVGSDGLIKTATTNLLTYSEDFLDASYVLYSNVGTITRTSNQAISPDGTLTADKIVYPAVSNSGNYSLLYKSAVNLTGTHATSIYLKGETGGERIYLFYTANGVYSSQLCVLTTEWQRFELTFTGGTISYWHLGYDLRTGTDQVAESGGTVYAWGAQLEQSSTVGEYVKTTSTINSAPRFNHDPTTGESLGLLVEESRTNLLLRSEEFDDAGIWTPDNASVTADSVTSPTGTVTADTLTRSGTSNARVVQFANTTGTNTATVSVYAKAGTQNFLAIQINTNSNTQAAFITFDLTTGSAGTSQPLLGGVSLVANPSSSVGDGWIRCSVSFINVGGTSVYLGASSAANTRNGTDGGTIYLWGAQLEAGSFPTSYIPTAGSAVTRAADVASISGTNFSSWYRQDEGTVFVETQLYSTSARNAAGFDINDNSANNRAIFRTFTTGSADQFTVRSGGSTVAQISSTGSPSVAIRKSAATISLNSYAISADGASPVEDTSGALPISVSQLFVGSALFGAESMGGYIRRLTYWQTRLSNDTLQSITL